MTSAMTDCAVLVAGAGVAGCAVGRQLAERGWPVIVVDATGDSPRASEAAGETIVAAARGELHRLGWTQRIEAAAKPVFGVEAWWGENLKTIPSIVDPNGESLAVERRELVGIARAAAATHCELRLGTCIEDVRGGAGSWQVEGRGWSVRARHLVDATGRSAKLARRLGAVWTRYDRLVSVGAFYESSSEPTLLVEAAPDGWFYSVPTRHGTAVAWLTDADLLLAGKSNDDRLDIALTVAPHTVRRIGAGRRRSAVTARAAQCGRLDRQEGEGWTAIGDAAEAWDPLSGSGLFRAVRSARLAAQRIDAVLRGTSRGTPATSRFDRHLQLRGTYYGQERHWSDRLFWRRRQGFAEAPITLPPQQVVAATGVPVTRAAELEAVVAPCALRILVGLCERPRPAHLVLQEFRCHPGHPGDRMAVQSLQRLIEAKVLRLAPSRVAC